MTSILQGEGKIRAFQLQENLSLCLVLISHPPLPGSFVYSFIWHFVHVSWYLLSICYVVGTAQHWVGNSKQYWLPPRCCSLVGEGRWLGNRHSAWSWWTQGAMGTYKGTSPDLRRLHKGFPQRKWMFKLRRGVEVCRGGGLFLAERTSCAKRQRKVEVVISHWTFWTERSLLWLEMEYKAEKDRVWNWSATNSLRIL